MQDARGASVEVLNDGAGPISLATEIVGENAADFDVDDTDCTSSPLPAGRTCEVDVLFDAGSGQYSATLVISANDGDQAQEVDLAGTSVL